jgi:hypothetical protein
VTYLSAADHDNESRNGEAETMVDDEVDDDYAVAVVVEDEAEPPLESRHT